MPDNEFSTAFSTAFDSTISDFPTPLTECWPVNWDVCPSAVLDGLSPELRTIAESSAVQTLRMLTGYRVGGCPTTVRPCNRSCLPGTWLTAPDVGVMFAGAFGGGFSPYVGLDGGWRNACGCTGDGCSCVKVREVWLPGTVGRVDEVQVDGIVLPSSAYRVDNSNRLVRQDGEDWPVCQDMNLPDGQVGTFSVTYLDGAPVDGVGSYVAGLLAAEFAKACIGADCALPSNVSSVTRAGITMEMDPEMFPGGVTGQFTVDAYIRIWNPMNSMPAGIYSPDAPTGRRTTWSGT